MKGPNIFNSLPKALRNITRKGAKDPEKINVDFFKKQLDKYLGQLPDEPLIPGYTPFRRQESNSIIDWGRTAGHNWSEEPVDEEPSQEERVVLTGWP